MISKDQGRVIRFIRNFDIKFDKLIKRKDAVQRKIGLAVLLRETQKGIFVTMKIDASNFVSKEFEIDKEYAQNKECVLENIKSQFSN
jgi:hypothetical protein